MRFGHRPWPAVLAVCMLGLALSACKGDGEGDSGECVDDRTYFQQEVWSFVGTECFACHSIGGDAQSTKFVLQPQTQQGWQEANMSIMRDVAGFEKEGVSILLSKPSETIAHEGGKIIEQDGAEYAALEEMIKRFDAPVTCGDSTKTESHFDGVVLLSPEETLRKATVNLAGRLPTAAEEFRVATGGEQALDVELDRIMLEDPFFDRVEQIFNDMFLVERYLGRNNAVDLLDLDYYPSADWYQDDDGRDFSGENQEFLEGARMYTNNSVAREPLKLASYLVRNNRPFTEIVTADYMLVNPYSARAYGITGLQWEDPLDPNEWQEGKIPGHVHAGVLTSPMWLNRFPTTDTNRNRHRARMVYWFFLATDVLKLAERPIDPSAINDFNPTVNNPNCNSCHAVIDPIAGTMQNWDAAGNYQPPEDGWFPEMFPPGYGETRLNYDDRLSAIRFLVDNIADDKRFATSMVHHVFRGVTGSDPIFFPTDSSDPNYETKLLQYEIQDRYFEGIAQKFIDTGYNLKTVFKEVVKSPYFRAKGHEEADASKLSEVAELGTGRLLTPELLDKKILAVTGQRWDDRDGDSYLLDENEYMILYGGIDSDDVTVRITEPNGIMSGIQYRMANDMSCRTVARDFTQPPEKRRYFPFTEVGFVPKDDNGFAVAAADAAIKKNIQYLHWHILGERLEDGHPELDRTYNLFVETWEEGSAKVVSEEVSGSLGSCAATTDIYGNDLSEEERLERDENYAVRSWMAVVTYLLADYNFLYE